MIVVPTTQSNYYFTNNESKKETSTENSIFENELSNTQSKEEEIKPLELKKSTRELVEDIISLLKTGFTKDELKMIEKLKEVILKKIKEEQENGTSNVKANENLLDELEKMISEFKKGDSQHINTQEELLLIQELKKHKIP